MSHWTWEYVPDAASVVGRLTPAQIDQVEGLAARIADAVAVRRIGTPFDVVEAVSKVKSYGEGPVMIWFLEDYRDDVVLVAAGEPEQIVTATLADFAKALDHVTLPPSVPAATATQLAWNVERLQAGDEIGKRPAGYRRRRRRS
jgi:hypothetical protein